MTRWLSFSIDDDARLASSGMMMHDLHHLGWWCTICIILDDDAQFASYEIMMLNLHHLRWWCTICIIWDDDTRFASSWMMMHNLHHLGWWCTICIIWDDDARFASSGMMMHDLHHLRWWCMICIIWDDDARFASSWMMMHNLHHLGLLILFMQVLTWELNKLNIDLQVGFKHFRMFLMNICRWVIWISCWKILSVLFPIQMKLLKDWKSYIYCWCTHCSICFS